MILRKSKPSLILSLAILLGITWAGTATYVVTSVPSAPVLLYGSHNAAASISKAKPSAPGISIVNSESISHASSNQPPEVQLTQPPAAITPNAGDSTKLHPCSECPVELTPSDNEAPACQYNCVPPKPYHCPPCLPGPNGRMMCPMIACRAIPEQDTVGPTL